MSGAVGLFEEHVLHYLRGLADPCDPPIGAGSFLLLYASQREVAVWFDPAHDNQRSPGEVLIPVTMLAAAWEALTVGQTLDLPALGQIAGGLAGAHWLLALLALLPGVRFTAEPPAVAWEPTIGEASEVIAISSLSLEEGL